MIANIMTEYLEYTKKFLASFVKEIFRDKIIPEAAEEYLTTYMDARYYNYDVDEKQRVFYRRVYSALTEKNEDLKYNAEEEDHKILDSMLDLYQYILYIDFVRPLKIEEKDLADQICKARTDTYELKRIPGHKEKITKMIKTFREAKENYLKNYASEDFKIALNRFAGQKDIFEVNLKYKFEIPYLFSKQATMEVYDTGVIYEDRIIVEFVLLTILNIRTIQTGNFDSQYIVDLPISMIEKSQKIEQLMNIIENPVIQERVKIRISFKDFTTNKTAIHQFMQRGFRFIIDLDDTFVVKPDELKKLEIFDYIIVHKKSKLYDNFKYYQKNIENLLVDGE